MISKYVQAVIELLRSGQKPDLVLGNLKTVLKQKGHLRLHRQILTKVLGQLERAEEDDIVLVTVANESAAKEQKEAIKRALESLEAPQDHKLKLDPNIVGGLIVETKDKRLDASYRSALLKLYRNVVS